MAALFPNLLGPSFETLAAPVRRAHGGGSHSFCGTATVERGTSIIARFVCALASLPPSMKNASVTVEIENLGERERWTRRFGASLPMPSTLRRAASNLAERLGPATLTFQLTVDGGAIIWTLVRISAFGCPLPTRLFKVFARSGPDGDRYRFDIDAGLRGVGRIIRYEGTLDVSP